MKKLTAILLVALLCFAAFANGNTEASKSAASEEALSTEKLIELAAQEKGDFIAYGNSSRIANAVTGFVAKYGAQLGLTEANAIGSKMNDSDIYTTIMQEYLSNSQKVASVVLIQDGATLQTYMASTDFLTNYVPAEMEGILSDSEKNPLIHQYINKLFIWNNIGANGQVVKNAWELTEPQWKDKIFFKNPNSEQVNMNFLIMCTSDEWAAKLADSYKALYGKDIELGSYKNAGYKWVAEFIKNCNFSISSDTTIAKTMAKADSEGCVGLFVLSKFRDVDASIKGNLSVGAWEAENVEPFAGFMYPLYIQLTTKANRPYTAKLFVNYLMSEEGFNPWGKDIGAYSPVASIPVHTEEGDKPITFWKDCLVTEDAGFVRLNKTAVSDFVNAAIAGK